MSIACAVLALTPAIAPAWAPGVATGEPASAASSPQLVIDGAGDGHGVGMSQDGALGLAEHGWSYNAILAHYYTQTALGNAPATTVVKVLVGSTVKRVPLESYVRGVVSAEMSASWPMAALEAQAVASRTYAITSDAGGAKFNVYSDDRSQVYRGKAAETSRTNTAVAATAGQIVTYAGKPAVTYFFAGSGGQTESVQNAFPGAEAEPWLVSVADPYEAGPLRRWSMTMSFAAAGSRLSGLVKGGFSGIEVSKRGVSPRIVSAYVLGTKGRTLVSGPELEARLGLYSTWAYFSVKNAKGTRAEPDGSGQSPAPASTPTSTPTPTPTAVPAKVGGTGGSAAAAGAPSGKPAGVDGQGGVTAG
ncbi:MAG TPA: SpoIID/LytB domain-containing protein [Solirubrobacteraceae bacterium]